MKHAPYSYSKLSTHNQCNRKFQYQYILKPKIKPKFNPALLKGGAIHSILEKYPVQASHKLAPKYQHIVDDFIKTRLGEKYLGVNSTREYRFGLTKDLEPTTYNDKNAMLRGSVDYVCIIDEIFEEIIEVDTLDDISDEYEILEVIE